MTLLTLLTLAAPAGAQYKVVAPDGSVTYTDRPRADGVVRITPISRSGAPAEPESSLPVELRQAAQRYPVTLYTTADCLPCDNARRLLQQRGVPYNERRAAGDEDSAALERIVGARTVPSLTIGSQVLRGLSEGDWQTYLDAAGYPRDSKLPKNWVVPAPTPLTERAPARAAAPPAVAPTPDAPPPAPGGVRF